jgi:bifunctional DNA-binding transcriptional regulator/antitoxin component of YhaV-PrlF toxin-antitoxin module
MIKNTDDKCRVIIPLDFRKELNIEPNQEIDIELVGKKIVISNPKGIMNKDEIETLYKETRKLNPTEYNQGFQDALKMILKK